MSLKTLKPRPSAKGNAASETVQLTGSNSNSEITENQTSAQALMGASLDPHTIGSDTEGKPEICAAKAPETVSGPLTHRGAVETSKDAAKVARKSHSKRCRRAYDLIEAAGDATCEEIQEALEEKGESWLLTSIRARVADLKRDGYVIPSGRKGIGESGKAKVTAWRITTEAERAGILSDRASKAVVTVSPSVRSEACARARAVLAASENVFDAILMAYSAQIMAEGGHNA